MSLIPMLFSDWWEDLDRPHRLWDQHFGIPVDPDDLNDSDSFNTDILLYRPHRRARRRYHPFLKGLNKRRGCGASTVLADKNKFQVTLDVSQFTPEEVNVKVVDQNVVVEAKHDEKEDEHGWISRQFIRKYIIPSQCDINQIESHLSSDGILSISVPRKVPLKPEANEKVVPIHYTGKPAISNCENTPNDTTELQKEPQTPQRGQHQQQQQQQQSQQQQHQRGRKGTAKVS